ncbi:hypothetical protein [Chryseobacterium hagamense]|uniref:Uncharacterized protein n=1 Tax=Chryseobacterium hagamense TaxID=395935 RepID=A0A511YHM9_9FLAO|nr:hypothetical protein [Chryseobacterium hagamense]GEN74704.1 hypothetical protein CHA01nite_04440 [Chryseobacterium hagamense]
MKNSMLNKLKSGYEEMEAKPSAGLWDRLDETLEEIPERTPKGSSLWWKYAAVVLLMVSLGTVLYLKYQNSSGFKKPVYVMKEGSKRMIYPEFSKPVVSGEAANQKKEIKATAGIPKNQAETEAEIKVMQPEISPVSIQHAAVQPQHIAQVIPVKIENTIPSVSDRTVAAERKTSYISANELLLGREFDKTSRPSGTDAVKFGVFNFDRPKVENVTVLGVTVYSDMK